MGAWETQPADPFAVNQTHFPEGMPEFAKPWANVSAAEFIAHTLRKRPGEITLLGLAPMTNIALAMALEPRLPQLAKELVFMGGSVACSSTFPLKAGTHCDAGQPWFEFNFWFDPHAAQKVLRTVPYTTERWRKITVLTADVASQPTWTQSLQDSVAMISNESAAAKYITNYLAMGDINFPLFDEMTVLWWLVCGASSRGASSRGASQCSFVDGAVELFLDVSTAWRNRGMMLSWGWGTGPNGTRIGTGPGLGEQQATVYLGTVHSVAFEAQFVALLH
jgi:hypothetical protein